MTRNRMAEVDSSIRNELCEVVNATIRYHIKQDPLSLDEKVAMWHWEIDRELLDAIELMKQCDYRVEHVYVDNVVFVVPEWRLGIRWYNREGRPFLGVPRNGPHKIKLHKHGNALLREISAKSLFDVLGEGQATKLDEWAKTAADVGVQSVEAKHTIRQVFGMIKTAGQLRRMVPDLIQYLPDYMQKDLATQERRSPFPDKWAEYDKARIDRMLVTLARGHLVKSMTDPSVRVYEDAFTWAQACAGCPS